MLHKYGEKQLCSIRDYTHSAGLAKGVRCIDLDCGELEYTVVADRAMDIYSAKYKGRQYAFLSPAGLSSAHFYDPHGAGWLKTFNGGLLVTCGLQNAGDPCEFAGESHGLHGRVANLPAENIQTFKRQCADGLEIGVCGEVYESTLMGARYRLARTVSSIVGGNSVQVADEITNLSDVPQPLMLLYHLNFGYPLINPNAKISVEGSEKIEPVDSEAAANLYRWDTLWEPVSGAPEQVYLHTLHKKDEASFKISGPDSQALHVRFSTAELPYMGLWKSLRPGEYALALEPCNNHIGGVAKESAAKTVRILAPGETAATSIRFTFEG